MIKQITIVAILIAWLSPANATNPLIPKDENPIGADACYNLDVTEFEALWECLTRPRIHTLSIRWEGSPIEEYRWEFTVNKKCRDMRGVFRKLILDAHAKVEGMNFAYDKIDQKDRSKPNNAFPECELMAQLAFEVDGNYPRWTDCLNYSPNEKIEHFVRCFVGQRMRKRNETEDQARAYLAKQNKGCDQLRRDYLYYLGEAFPEWGSPAGGGMHGVPTDIQPISCEELLAVNIGSYPIKWRYQH